MAHHGVIKWCFPHVAFTKCVCQSMLHGWKQLFKSCCIILLVWPINSNNLFIYSVWCEQLSMAIYCTYYLG